MSVIVLFFFFRRTKAKCFDLVFGVLLLMKMLLIRLCHIWRKKLHFFSNSYVFSAPTNIKIIKTMLDMRSRRPTKTPRKLDVQSTWMKYEMSIWWSCIKLPSCIVQSEKNPGDESAEKMSGIKFCVKIKFSE